MRIRDNGSYPDIMEPRQACATLQSKWWVTPQNYPPTLREGSVNAATDNAGTTFIYEVTCADEDGDIPKYVKVYIDGTEHDLSLWRLQNGSPVFIQLDDDFYRHRSHTYYFEASDGTYIARLPASGSNSGPVVTEEEANQTPIGGGRYIGQYSLLPQLGLSPH